MSDKLKLILFSILLVGVLLLTYSNHWHNEFHFDDSHTVQNNVYIQHISNIPLFFKDNKTFSTLPSHCSYRPLVSTSLAIDYYLGNGLNPVYFHLSTFILFLLQGLLMYFMFLKILNTVSAKTPNSFISFFAVAFYMVHPALAETINYVISRSDTLSTFFVVLGFVVYQYSAFARKYFLYLIPIIIGSMAKPTAFMFAPMLLVYDILFNQKISLLDFAKIDWKKLLLVVPSFIIVVALYLFFKHKEEGLFDPGGYSLFRYVITQPFVYVHYISQFFLPTKLSADTDWSTFESLGDPKAIIGFVFLGSMTFGIFYLSKFQRWRPVAFGFAWFLLALVPTTLVPLAEVMNDHRVFYPFVGFTLSVVWAAYLLLEKLLQKVPSAALTAVLGVTLCVYAYGVHERNKVWKNEDSLWTDVTTKSPKNGRGLMNYGLVFMGRNSLDTANYYFTKALEYCPNYSLLHVNMAILKNTLGDTLAAEKFFEKGISYGGDDAGNYYFYARFLKSRGRTSDAIANLYSCIRLVDARMDARYMLMPMLYEQKRMEELKIIAARTLQLAPNDATATMYLNMANTGKSQLQLAEEASANYKTADEFLNLSLLYYNASDFQGCINAAQKALAIKPDYAEAWNNICSSYNAMNNFEEGIKACEQALKIKPGYSLAQGNLNFAKRSLKK
ncbi:MAG: tetratricopeptide repeat protein [Bacteroidota bacterium]|nr:tetratricopeptide repeat protein [Bacteroidota bacterium]